MFAEQDCGLPGRNITNRRRHERIEKNPPFRKSCAPNEKDHVKTILIVDDRAESRTGLRILLGFHGYRIVEASNAADGLDLIRREMPDLVIADLLMPETDGYAFVRQLRAEPAIAQTKVVFHSATYREEEAGDLARACGVKHVIAKPGKPEDILTTIEQALGISELASLPDDAFDQEHLRVVTDKLVAKVDELESLNAALEKRVAARTAELAAANEELRDLDKMKDEFLAIVSHDLRSPLSSIALVTEQMVRQGDDLAVEKRRHLLGMIAKTVGHQLEMVNDLLELAKNASGSVRLEPSEFSLSEMVRECVHAAGVVAAAKQLAVESTLPHDEPLFRGDRLKLTRVINNLLTNAIKFTPTTGQIAVTLAWDKDDVVLQVADSGVGIDPDRLSRLFEKFTIDSRRGTAGEEGTGLGLGIVRQIVELHGGQVTVQSEVGRGSAFQVRLPHAPRKSGS